MDSHNIRLSCCPYPPAPKPAPEASGFFAQYFTISNPASNSFLPLNEHFNYGDGISLADEYTISLAPGYLYQIDYVFLATPEADSYIEIIPHINGVPRLVYAYFAPSGSARNASAAAGFTTNEAADNPAALAFHISYPQQTRNIDISGAVSVTPLIAVRG